MYSVNPCGDTRLSCNSGSRVLPPECPWTALRFRKWLEEFGFKQPWNLFLALPPFARVEIQSLSDHCEAPSTFFFLTSSRISSNRTAPSSSRGSDWPCRSGRIMAFDTVKQSWSCSSMSIHFLSCGGTETADSVTAGFSRGLALATGLTKARCSSFLVSIDSVTFLSIPLTIRTQEAVRSWNRDSTRTSIQYRSLWRQTYMSKTGPILVFLRIPPFARVFFSYLGIVYSRHKCCILPPSVSVWRNIVLFGQTSNQRQSIVWITSGHQTLVRICAHSIAPGFTVAVRWCAGQQEFPSFPNDQVLQVSPTFLNLWVILCTNLPLLRGHWADLQKLSWREVTRCLLRYRWSEQTSYHVLCFLIPLSQRHWKHEMLSDRILYVIGASSFLHFCPNFRLVHHNTSHTILFLIQVLRKTNDSKGICERISQL